MSLDQIFQRNDQQFITFGVPTGLGELRRSGLVLKLIMLVVRQFVSYQQRCRCKALGCPRIPPRLETALLDQFLGLGALGLGEV